jgi:outer membrane protein assembly factor BamA
LYDKYVDWGIIGRDEKDGGNANFLKFGLVFDTRDNEANPMKGAWSEALVVVSPKFLFNDRSFAKLILIHRQYFTLIPDRLSFVYRLGYQGSIGNQAPFFFQPYMLSSFLNGNQDRRAWRCQEPAWDHAQPCGGRRNCIRKL